MPSKLLISHISLGQAATVINVLIGFLHYTLALGIVALLVYFLPAVNPAVAWNVIGRKLHSSLWPTLLHTDKLRGSGFRVVFFSYLSVLTTLLVGVAGIVMPLGLSTGADLHAPMTTSPASFVADTSPIGLATSPRDNYVYGRLCGSKVGECPAGAVNTTVIPADIVNRFNSTPYGNFGMQFRRYYNGATEFHYPILLPQFATTESLILRNGIFAIDGLIVDLDNPGIGLWNHTLPVGTSHGATWSEDVLWLEPVSECVDTNLTIDYVLENAASFSNQVDSYNLVDHGGFYNLPRDDPTLDGEGQNINLQQHAYKGAVLSNFLTMSNLNLTARNESYEGKTFPLTYNQTTFFGGQTQTLNMLYMGPVNTDNLTANEGDLLVLCQNYGGGDAANISTVAVHCSGFLGPPQRTDGGNPLLPGDNSTWSQRMFTCASGTRARMQTIDFTFNGTMDLNALTMTRRDIDTPVLWATEATGMTIAEVDLLWGRVSDSFENDPNLQTIRSDVFYVPAGATDILGVTTGGMSSVVPALAWGTISNDLTNTQIVDYSGVSNYALLRKFQELILADPLNGAAQIRKLMWTDIMANNLVGTDSRSTLVMQETISTIAYDLRYAIPLFLLLLLWLPTFVVAAFVLATGLLKVSYLRFFLTHTGPGRIVVGDSALRPAAHGPGFNLGYLPPSTPMSSIGVAQDEVHWAKEGGRRLVCVGGSPVEKGGVSTVATDFTPS
ncbi:hypothetical protein MSAN_00557100 [Mycena sanguinolenta]|uniref:Uncharacterized protein n=1 Tax=Mycena sanguinolenta TaxID=230812 RepID=A0A8H6ZA49_9AGAR|nr:hypothetical protein MSAN_00557100 [Mycena sanguinolenta]